LSIVKNKFKVSVSLSEIRKCYARHYDQDDKYKCDSCIVIYCSHFGNIFGNLLAHG